MSIRDASDDELMAEVQRRQALAEERKKIAPPELVLPDWGAVHRTVVNGVQQAVRDGYVDDDLSTYVYEAAMEAVYGPDFWKWWNTLDR